MSDYGLTADISLPDDGLSAEQILLGETIEAGAEGAQRFIYPSLRFLVDYLNQVIRSIRRDPEVVEVEVVDAEDVNGTNDMIYVRVDPEKVQGENSFYLADAQAQDRRRVGNLHDTDNGIFEIIPPLPEQLELRVDVGQWIRQRDAIRRWSDRPHPARSQFFNLLKPLRNAEWKPIQQVELLTPEFLTDESRPGTTQQLEFVRKALGTPDFAFLHGPPGSGKTTAICELISQLVRRGQRVLLCGTTHESIDNVLERIVERNDSNRHSVLPIRVGNNQNKMSPTALEYHISALSATVRQRARNELQNEPNRTLAQDRALGSFQGKYRDIDDMILRSANLVCGTPSGVTGDDRFEAYFKAGEPIFDVLIVDEASKLQLVDLMYAGLLAKKWVLSGDPLQLPPHSSPRDISRQLKLKMGLALNVEDEDPDPDVDERGSMDPESGDIDISKVALSVDTRFQYRSMLGSRALQEANERLDRELAKDPDRIDAWETAIQSVESLFLRSAMEGMISPRRESDGFHDERYTAAVDVGIPDPHRSARTTLLTYQHRMHPDISLMPREHVYSNDALQDPPDMAERRQWTYSRYTSRAIFLNVQSPRTNISTREWWELETKIALRELQEFVNWSDQFSPDAERTVSLITFYRNMRDRLHTGLASFSGQRLDGERVRLGRNGQVTTRVGTVDSFQGRESDLVLLCVGKENLTSFSGSLNRANVAITRAKYQLVIVGNRDRFARGRQGRLLEHLARQLPHGDFLETSR